DYLRKNTGGATFDTIIVDTFRRMRITCPPGPLISQFSAVVGQLLEQIRNLLDRTDLLRASRDLLLPKLISGEVDVSDLDIEVPDVPEVDEAIEATREEHHETAEPTASSPPRRQKAPTQPPRKTDAAAP